ncbi:hypothetical protein GCK72_004092 [Caenorhabditis remanei]|uniref:BTB domain-containing protein n=1 Tax=Caenorhabditis remanei TaxID=31234 RepID=A0A6A5HAD0_CAERE|nr:hypothetical protein GCK72_004092 [Caenorhabditis remanei]KAF1764145.1 hypothetical protein GCK72_004092 [Caenorhabditis remanei]
MSNGAIEYKSGTHEFNGCDTNVSETSVKNGVTCVWSGTLDNYCYIDFTWKFDWSELKSQGVDELTGHITVSSDYNHFTATKIDVKITENNQEITEQVGGDYVFDDVFYEYSLIPHYEISSYGEMFAPSDQNDAIMLVDGKKLHFLSYHSEYFRALFSSNFKEGQMDEIPIGDVSYEDFALLLSTFHPDPVFVTDAIVEKLLELARRFLVPSVIKVTEYYLINWSNIENEKMLWLADEYGMSKLLEKSIRKITTVENAKKLKKSENYDQLSDKTKAKVFDCLLDSI